jgi:hypothetical protein
MNCCPLEFPVKSRSSLYTLYKSNWKPVENNKNEGIKHGSYERRLMKLRVFKLSSKFKIKKTTCVS